MSDEGVISDQETFIADFVLIHLKSLVMNVRTNTQYVFQTRAGGFSESSSIFGGTRVPQIVYFFRHASVSSTYPVQSGITAVLRRITVVLP